MFLWNPDRTLESKLIPGVRYHFKAFSAGRRADLELQLTDYRSQMRDLSIAYNDGLENVPENEQMVGARRTAIELLRDRIGQPVTEDMIDAVNRRAIDLMPSFRSAEYRRNQARQAAFGVEIESIIKRHEKPATLRAYLKRIEGITLDGENEMTIAQFIADGPEALTDEAAEYIRANGGLDPEAIKNSQSPSISSDPAPGGASVTTAGNAETGATTSDAGVPATSPTP